VGVDHGRGDVAMAEELLDGADVVTAFEEVRGKGVTQGVAADALGETCCPRGLSDCLLHDGFVEVVATPLTGRLVEVRTGNGEAPLPRPLALRVRILVAKSLWELDVASPVAHI
jgi:hypothetical protein